MLNRFVTQKIENSDSNLLSGRTEKDDDKQKNEVVAGLDEQSSKRFIELLNGQPVRNTRNIFKNSNRVEFEFYRVSALILTIYRVSAASSATSGTRSSASTTSSPRCTCSWSGS